MTSPQDTLPRRSFLRLASGVSVAFAGLGRHWARAGVWTAPADGQVGYGPLIPDPEGLLDLPAGWSYTVFSQRGDTMADGLVVPGQHDGMAAFPGPEGTTVLVRNHEMTPEHDVPGPFGANLEGYHDLDTTKVYDHGRHPLGGPCPSRGGCTRLVYDTRARRLVDHRMVLAGTEYNCAGGPTPEGHWVTCEETVVGPEHGAPWTQPHGYCFEVPSTTTELVTPRPITTMGRFRHEAVGVNPDTGIVYLTEDLDDGILYRYLPDKPGALLEGGRLQALALTGHTSADTRDWDAPPVMRPGDVQPVRWVDLEDVDSADDTLRYQGFEKGCARFARAEGMWHGDGEVFFACTTGGRARAGQLWRYRPAPPGIEGTAAEADRPGTLELFLQPDDRGVLDNADNITQSPRGDLVVCEDGSGDEHLLGVTPGGEVYRIGRNARNGSEFAGCCFSPDGSTLFVNLQRPGLTLAIAPGVPT